MMLFQRTSQSMLKHSSSTQRWIQLSATQFSHYPKKPLSFAASKTTESITFATTIKNIKNPRLFQIGSPTIRSFSSSDDSDESSSETLGRIINEEIQEEENLKTTQMPEELSDLLQNDIEPNWRLVDNPDSGIVRLFRKPDANMGNKGKIIISFHCQDTVQPDASLLDGILPNDNQAAPNENDDEEEDEEDENPDPIRFTVTVTQAGKSVLFSCLSEEASVSIESIIVKDGEEQSNDHEGISSDLYQGPQFDELIQELQDAFYDFLKDECGVDEDRKSVV